MNWRHFQAMVWLRWRLRLNQLKRDGIVSTVILAILAVVLACSAVGLFIGMVIGGFALRNESPAVVMYVWDGLVFLFLLWWVVGLLMDLQRMDVLSLDKFMHLPVSLASAFVINYLSSMASLGLALFVSAAAGLSLGLCLAKGPAMLLLLPLTAAFLLMVTALSYQFQGWLASMMANQRRRRTIIVFVTFVFLLVAQAPNVVFNVLRPWDNPVQREREKSARAALDARRADLERSFAAKEISEEKYYAVHQQIWQEYQQQSTAAFEPWQRGIWLVNLLLPAGWLPLGAMASAEGRLGIAALSILGLSLIGTASLWRSYRTTLRLYTGYFTAGSARTVPQAARKKAEKSRPPLVEKKLPGVSEQVSAIALSCLLSLWRSPEVKLVLVMPLVLVLIFGSMAFANASGEPPTFLRAFLPSGAMAMILITMSQLVGNQFGLDRSGFRAFVLGPVPRRDILFAKNLAAAPFALGTGLVLAVGFQLLYPAPLDYFLAAPFLLVSMYLAFCLLANVVSIIAPLALRPGNMRPVKVGGTTYVLYMLFTLLMPVVLAPMFLPLIAAVALAELAGTTGWPICLSLSLLECGAMVFCYRLGVNGEGRWLQQREQKILAVVAVKEE